MINIAKVSVFLIDCSGWYDNRDDVPQDSLCHKVLVPRGTVFVRDVNVWHSGTANTTGFTRHLPCIRLATVRQRLPISYRSLENRLWLKYFGCAHAMTEP